MNKRKIITLSIEDIKTLTVEAIDNGDNLKNHIEKILHQRAEKLRKKEEA